MKTQHQTAYRDHNRTGRNVALAIYVILNTVVISAYTLLQYFTM